MNGLMLYKERLLLYIFFLLWCGTWVLLPFVLFMPRLLAPLWLLAWGTGLNMIWREKEELVEAGRMMEKKVKRRIGRLKPTSALL